MTTEATGVPAGTGKATWAGEPAEGTIREVKDPGDVLDLLDDTPDDLVVLMHTAGATTLAPLFGDIKGIVCTTGNEGSHVAILSRDFGVPCLVAAELSEPDLDGKRVRLTSEGEILLLDAG